MNEIVEILFFVNMLLALSAALGALLSFMLFKKTAMFRKYGVICAGLSLFAFVVLVAGVLLKQFDVAFVTDFINYIIIGGTAVYLIVNWAAIPYILMVADLFEYPKGLKLAARCLVIPPIGQVILIAKIKGNDVIPTREMCLSGDALTYAALNSYRTAFGECDYSEEDYTVPELSEAEIKTRVKELKRCNTPEDLYKYGLFVAYYMPENVRTAMNAFESAAKGGVAQAYKQLGYIYLRASRPDYKKAEKCFKNALQRGDESAELPLGILYCKNGRASEGMSLFNQRAYNSNPYGFYNTGVCYELGNGVKENISSALEFYMRAAERNCLVAQKRMFVLLAEYAFKEFDSKLSVEDFNNIQDWAQKSAYNGFRCMANALLYIATQEIKDTSTSLLLAVRCRGYWERYARTLIGTIYADCGASAEDRDNGVKYVKTAIDMGDKTAEEMLPFVEKLVESKNSGLTAKPKNKKVEQNPKKPKKEKPKKQKRGKNDNDEDAIEVYEVPNPDDIIDGKVNIKD